MIPTWQTKNKQKNKAEIQREKVTGMCLKCQGLSKNGH